MSQVYDTIGQGYPRTRQPDPRLASRIQTALADSESIVNVGAGTGSYEPSDRFVLAVEPSCTMISQRTSMGSVVQASATHLPLRTGSFDAALAVLTLHHWPEPARGLGELRRVARQRVVIVTWDPAFAGFWLTDYFPEILAIDREIFPSLAAITNVLGEVECSPLRIPHDCTDGFLGAYWRRPSKYLQLEVRKGMSTFARIDRADERVAGLARDLESGAWRDRYGDLLRESSMDLGYRLIVATCP